MTTRITFTGALVCTVALAMRLALFAQAPAGQTLVASYEGVMPCADCPGLRTALSLYASPGANPASGGYTSRFTYEGRGVIRDEAGRWTIVKGTPADPNATVYQLTEARSSQAQFWLKVSDTELRQLDSSRRELNMRASMNHSLKRTSPAAAPPPGAYRAAPIGVAHPAVNAAAAFAVDQQKSGSQRIQLVSVIRAETQVVAGTNFRLCLSVTRDGAPASVLAIVFRDLKDTMSLTSWTPGGCSASPVSAPPQK